MTTKYEQKLMELNAKARQDQLAEREEAEARAKKNYNFVQVEKKALRQIRELFAENPNAGKVLFILAERMNRQNALVCSFKTLMTMTGFGRTTIYKSVKYLKDHQWIQVIKIGTANAYVVNSRVFWQSYGDKKWTVFNASVVATSDEQEDEIDNQLELKHYPFVMKKEIVLLSENEKEDPPVNEEMDLV